MKPRGRLSGLIRLWRADELKNGRTRTVPMTTACHEALLLCREIPGGPFSTITKGLAGHVWKKAKKHAGITEPQCVIHSLRHTYATRLLETIGDIKLVQEWLAHTSILTTAKTYAHVQTHRMVDAAALLSQARHLGFE